ncbi:MAG: segregation ATPase FtsK/SpoIIIE, family [Bacillota bacterium]|nr:segregation ATPase FtsK/SpoIIIE, family [Bacillota bacterium]
MPQAEKKPKREQKPAAIGGILVTALSLLVMVSLFSERAGVVGGFLHRVLLALFGWGAYPLPVISLGGALFTLSGRSIENIQVIGASLLFLATVGAMQLVIAPEAFPAAGELGRGGGIAGAVIATFLLRLFGRPGAWIILVATALSGLVLINEKSLVALANCTRFRRVLRARTPQARVAQEEGGSGRLPEEPPEKKEVPPPPSGSPLRAEAAPTAGLVVKTGAAEPVGTPVQLAIPQVVGPYQLPPVTLLRKPVRLKNYRLEKDIAENVRLLEETLSNFGISAKVTEVSRGPAITRYEIHPAPGTKVSRIVGLADDIALSLAATDVRIEAPIPGKAAIGIEVPNKEITPVYLREVIDTPIFARETSPLTIALGKDISGTPVVADLAKMPHLLIAGATGSGKSVCINALISSILFKATPAQVKLLLIDPKMVELTAYNGIPHLISPVVTDVRKAAGVLNWAVTEMENRYSLFAAAGVRDIKRYNETRPPANALPYIVIVIDELADLMMVSPAEVEEAICRLAQMARAAGLHLVVATQRPSVDVITGLIKANIPSRLSFAVSSQTDSRTILDMNGAEKLLGRGDMLFLPVGASKPQRVQGAFISDSEVEELVNFWRGQGEPEFQEAILTVQPKEKEPADEAEDELFGKALELVIEAGHASASYLQRRLRIGYTRAARIIDQMAEKGYVGPAEGSKPRPVLISKERYQHLMSSDARASATKG